jgi:hypothetical protein
MFSRADLIKLTHGGDELEMQRATARQQIQAQSVFLAMKGDEAVIDEDTLVKIEADLCGAIKRVNGQARTFVPDDVDRILTVREIVGLWVDWHARSGLGEQTEVSSPAQ